MSETSEKRISHEHAPITPEQLLRIPSEHFITMHVEIPEDSEASEVVSFLELQLEEHSPFALEQLAWGFWREGNEALIYAAPEKLVNSMIEEHLETVRWAVPGFLPHVISKDLNEGLYRLIDEGNGAHSLLVYSAESKLPKIVLSTRDEENPAETLYKHAGRYGLNDFSLSEIKKIEPLSPTRAPRRHVRFAKQGEPRNKGHFLLSLSLLQGDLRDNSFIQYETKRRKFGLMLWKTSLGLACVFALLFIAQAGLWAYNSRTESLTLRYSDKAPAAQIVEEKQTLFRKLSEAVSKPLQPFEVLDAINTFRPRTIHFTAASFDEDGSIRLDGNAVSFEEVNQYYEKIEETNLFSSIDLSDLERRDQRGIQFKLFVTL